MRNNKTKELVLTGLFMAIIIIMAFTPLGYIPLGVFNATIIHIPVILGSLFCGPVKGGVLGFTFGLTSFIKNTMTGGVSAFVFSPILAYSSMGISGVPKSIFICFVPRILVGVVPYLIYVLVKKILESKQKNVWGTILNLVVCALLFIGIRSYLYKLFAEKGTNQSVGTIISLVIALIIAVVMELIYLKKEVTAIPFIYAGICGAFVNTLLVMGGIAAFYLDEYGVALGKEDMSAVIGVIGSAISFNGVMEAIVAAILVSAIGIILKKVKPIYSKVQEPKKEAVS